MPRKGKKTEDNTVVVHSYEGTSIGARVNSKMSGRSPPFYHPITLITMREHQTNQRQKVTIGLDKNSLCYIASRIR